MMHRMPAIMFLHNSFSFVVFSISVPFAFIINPFCHSLSHLASLFASAMFPMYHSYSYQIYHTWQKGIISIVLLVVLSCLKSFLSV